MQISADVNQYTETTSVIFEGRVKNVVFNHLDTHTSLLFNLNIKHAVSPTDIAIVLFVWYTESPLAQVLTDKYTACL